MSPETFVILALATYRLSLLISKEPGPFDILGKFRTWAGVEYDQYSHPQATGQLSEAIMCPYCLSVWIGICVTLVVVAAQYLNLLPLVTYALLPFALSGLAVAFFKWFGV